MPTPGPSVSSWAILALTGGPTCCFLQDQVAKSAVKALASLYGTQFDYGSIITTICKWPLLVAQDQHQLTLPAQDTHIWEPGWGEGPFVPDSWRVG